MGNIVLVGAGGTGMSGVAGLLHDLGYANIICLDGFQSQLTDQLKKKGLKVIIGHGKYTPNLDDTIIYSEAVADSIEVQSAKELATKNKKIIPIFNYFQFLGEISKYFITTGLAGTNGKSSTTALAIYGAKNTLPNFGLGILGALIPDFNNESYYLNTNHKNEIKSIFDFILTGKNLSNIQNSTFNITKKFHFFVEACEYKRHFLNLDLDYSIITSLELDHTDYYKDFDDYLDAFQSLINKTKNKIFIPSNLVSNIQHLVSNIKDKLIKVSIENINFKHIQGKHNDLNGSLVIKLINELNHLKSSFKSSEIANFKGIRRRMELIGNNNNGAQIYSDYGHIASSIDIGYDTIKQKYPDKKIFVIFQPHQINRIALGRDAFIKALQKYDKTVIYDIYAARESLNLTKKIGNFNTLEELGNAFAQACNSKYIKNFEELMPIINSANQDYVIVIYSAGDIDYKIRNRIAGAESTP